MNCQEVQAQLSDYVDLSLVAPRLVLVEEHLAGCAPCREEADLLGESIRAVATLPWLDTPLGFSQRVMSHVREAETQPGFWQRFFLPLSGKIPAQATAVVIAGVLGIYLLQKEQPHQQLPPPAITTADAPFTADEPEAPKSSVLAPSENSVTQEKAQIQSPGQPLQSGLREDSRRGFDNPPSPSITSVPAPSFLAPQSTEATVRATPIVSGTPVFNSPESDSPALRSSPATIEPFADLELILRRHTTPPEPHGDVGAGALRKGEVSPANPRPIERLMAAIPDRTRPQTIWINVPEYQYEDFKKELHALGIVESETRVPLMRDQTASYSDGQIRVKLTALPAGETANPAAGR